MADSNLDKLMAARASLGRVGTTATRASSTPPADEPMAVDTRGAQSSYRQASDVERWFNSAGNVGRSIMELSGWDPDTFLNGKLDVDQIWPFIKSIPLGMVSAIPSALEKGYEAATGKPISEMVDNSWIPDYQLTGEQRVATGLDAAIDVVGLPFGATGKALKFGGELLGVLGKQAAKKTAKETAGKAALSVLGGSAEEAVEETTQSILGDIREGTDTFGGDHDWEKAFKAGAAGFLGGLVMHGVTRGASAGISYIDKSAAKQSNKVSTTNTPASYSFDITGKDKILAPTQQAISEELDRVSEYAASSYGRGIVSNHVKLNEIHVGGKTFLRQIIRESAIEPGQRQKQWLIPLLNAAVQRGDLVLTGMKQGQTVEDFARELDVSGDASGWNQFVQDVNVWLGKIGGLNYHIFKNPGGLKGAVPVKLTALTGTSNVITLHGMLSTMLGSDFDSDSYSIIASDVLTRNTGNGTQTNVPTMASMLSNMNGRSITNEMWASSQMTAEDVDGMVQAFQDMYADLDPNRLEQFGITDEAIWKDYVQSVFNDALNGIYGTKNDVISSAFSNDRDAVKAVYDSYPGLPSLVGICIKSQKTDISEKIYDAFASGAVQQSTIARTEQMAAEANDRATRTIDEKINGVVDEFETPARTKNDTDTLDIIMRHFRNSVYSPLNNFCRQNLSLYFAVEDLIDDVRRQMESREGVSFLSAIESVMLNNMRMEGFGLHPHDVVITVLREYLAVVSQLDETQKQQIIDISDSQKYEDYKSNFRREYTSLRKFYVEEYSKNHDGDTANANLIFPEISDSNIDQQISTAIANMDISFVIGKNKDGQDYGYTVEEIVSDIVASSVDVDTFTSRSPLEITRTWLRNQTRFPEISKVDEVAIGNTLAKLVYGAAKRKDSEARAFVDLYNKLFSEKTHPGLRATIARIAGAKNMRISFKGNEGLADLNVMDQFLSSLYVIAGGKRFRNVGWDTVGGFFDGESQQQQTYWGLDTKTKVSITSRIRNRLISIKTADIQSGLVSLAVYDNTSKFRNALYELKIAIENNKSPDDAIIKLENAAAELGYISPFYRAIVNNTFIGSIYKNGAINTADSSLPSAIDNAIQAIEKFIDPELDLVGKMDTAAYLNIGYSGRLNVSQGNEIDMFFTDVMASKSDMDNISTVSSNIRKASVYLRDIELNTIEYWNKQGTKFMEAANGVSDFNELMKAIEDQQEELVEDLDVDVYAMPLIDIHDQVTSDAVKKTLSRPAFYAAWALQTIRKSGRVVCDVHNLFDEKFGAISFEEIQEYPALMSRLILTSFIDDRGGISLVWNGKTVTYNSRAEFLADLCGCEVKTRQDTNEIIWERGMVQNLLSRNPSLINAIMPTYCTAVDTDGNIKIMSNATSPDADFVDFNTLVSDRKANQQTLYERRKKKQIMNRIMSDPRGVAAVMSVISNRNPNFDFRNEHHAKAAFREAIDIVWNGGRYLADQCRSTGMSSFDEKYYGLITDGQTDAMLKKIETAVWLYSKNIANDLRSGDLARIEDLVDAEAQEMSVSNAFSSVIIQGVGNILRDDGIKVPEVEAGTAGLQSIQSAVRNLLQARASSGIEESSILLRFIKWAKNGFKNEPVETGVVDLNNWLNEVIRLNAGSGVDLQGLRDKVVKSLSAISGISISNQQAGGLSIRLHSVDFSTIGVASVVSEIQRFFKEAVDNGYISDALASSRVEMLSKAFQALSTFLGDNFDASSFISANQDIKRHLIDTLRTNSLAVEQMYGKDGLESAIADAIKTGNQVTAIDKCHELFETEMFHLIQEFTELSRVDVAFSTQASYDAIMHDAIRTVATEIHNDNNIRTTSAHGDERPQFAGVNFNPLSAQAVARYVDELYRGNVMLGVSTIASARFKSFSQFTDCPADLHNGAAEWQTVPARKLSDVLGTLSEYIDLFNKLTEKGEDSFFSDPIATARYYENGQVKEMSRYELRSIYRSYQASLVDPTNQPFADRDIQLCGAWEQNAGFDSRYYGANEFGSPNHNPYADAADKIVLNGAEQKQLKTAKKFKMFVNTLFGNTDSAFTKSLRALLKIEDTSSVTAIVDRVENAKSAYLQKLAEQYYSDEKFYQKADLELQLSMLNLKSLVDGAFQYVTVKLDTPYVTSSGLLVTQFAIPYFQLINAQDKSVGLSDLDYSVTFSDGTNAKVGDVLSGKSAVVEACPISPTTLNEFLRKNNFQYAKDQAKSGPVDYSNDKMWMEAFANSLVNGLQNGSRLFDLVFENADQRTAAISECLADLSYNMNRIGSKIPAQLRGYTPNRSVSESADYTTNTKKINDILVARRNLQSQVLRNGEKVVATFGVPSGSAAFNLSGQTNDTDSIAARGVFDKNDTILIGSDSVGYDNIASFMRIVGGREPGQIKTVVISSSQTNLVSRLQNTSLIGEASKNPIRLTSVNGSTEMFYEYPIISKGARVGSRVGNVDIVKIDPQRININIFTERQPGDGFGHINNINASCFRNLEYSWSTSIRPSSSVTTGAITIADPKQAIADLNNTLGNNQRLSDSNRIDLTGFRTEEEKALVRSAIDGLATYNSNNGKFSGGLATEFPSYNVDVNCLGFYQYTSGGQKVYIPIVCRTGLTSTLTGIEVNGTAITVNCNWKFDKNSFIEDAASLKEFFQYSGLKGMVGVLDTDVDGIYEAAGHTGATIWNSKFNAGKYDYEEIRIRNYHMFMLLHSNSNGNKLLSMFFKENDDGSISLRNDIFQDGNSKWTEADKAALLFGRKEEVQAINERLKNGDLALRYDGTTNDIEFQRAMQIIIDNYLDSIGTARFSFADVLSGRKIEQGDNGSFVDNNYAPLTVDPLAIYDRLSEPRLNLVFSKISNEHWTNSPQAGDTTFDYYGLMNISNDMLFGSEPKRMKVVFEESVGANGVSTSTDNTASAVSFSDKIAFLTALSQGASAGVDRGPLRAEAMLYMSARDAKPYIPKTEISDSFSEARSTTADPFAATALSSYLGVTEEQRQARFKSYMDLNVYDTLVAERTARPPILVSKRRKGTKDSYIKSLSDIRSSRDPELKTLQLKLDMLEKHFKDENGNQVEITDEFFWDVIASGQLAYSKNGESGEFRIYQKDVEAAIDKVCANINDKKFLVTDEGITGRYTCPILLPETVNFYFKYCDNKINENDYVATVAGYTLSSMNKVECSSDPKQIRAILNMVEAYKGADPRLDREIKTHIVNGTVNIMDIANTANAISVYTVGDTFKDLRDFNDTINNYIARQTSRREAHYKRMAISPDLSEAGKNWRRILGARPQYREEFIDGFAGDWLSALANISRVQAMFLPELMPTSLVERGVIGNTVRSALLLGIKYNKGPYRSEVDRYITNPGNRNTFIEIVRNAASDDRITTLIENRRILNLLASEGYSEEMIQAAGGLKVFIERHKDQSTKLRRAYEMFMDFQTGKGFGKRMQTQVFVMDLIRRISLDPSLANVLLAADENNTPAILKYIQDPATFQNWLYTNCFDMNGALYTLANQSFNFSMQGDAAFKTPLSILISEICTQHPVLGFFNTTMLCRFPMYAINVTERFANVLLPMSSIRYVIAKYGSNPESKLGQMELRGLRGSEGRMKVWELHLEDSIVEASFKEALGKDLALMGTMGLATLIFAMSGAIEPPPDDDKWGNIDEWLLFGNRIGAKWWMKDLIGPALGYAAMWKSCALGRPRADLLVGTILDSMYANPVIKASDVVQAIFNPYYEYMESYYNDVDRFSKSVDGKPTPSDVFWANTGVFTLNWATQFLLPSFWRELYKASEPYEVSYKKVAKTNEYGDVVKSDDGTIQYEYAPYFEQKLRLMTRDNPVLAFLANLFTGKSGEGVGYLRSEMPRTVYYDPTQLDCYQALSLWTTDENGNVVEKTEQEKQAIALGVIVKLQQYDPEELYQQGFCLPYSTMRYVSDVIWDIAYEKRVMYDAMLENGQMDYAVLGDGDVEYGKQVAAMITANFEQDTYYWKDFYYNKLWSEPMRRGLQEYNRWSTSYAQDDNGEWYATGYTKGGLLSVFTLFERAPMTGNLGYEGDWMTPSAVTGESTGERALVPYTEMVNTPDWDSLGVTENGGYSSSYPKYMSSYKYPSSSGYGRSGGSRSYGRGTNYNPPKIYAPDSVGTRYLNGPTYSNSGGRPVMSANLHDYYLRPGFETKGSRKAYKREDI